MKTLCRPASHFLFLLFSISMTLILPIDGKAQQLDNPYYFGGPCTSQGTWTQEALSAANRIKQVAEQLRDDKNCSALKNAILKHIETLNSEVGGISKTTDHQNRASRLAQIPQEISALRSFLASSGGMKRQVLQMIMNRNIEGATLSAQAAATSKGTDASTSYSSSQVVSEGLQDFGTRLLRTSRSGMRTMNDIIESLPQASECITDDAILGQYVASSVQVLSSFVASGQDSTGSLLAESISKLSSYLRNKRFSKVLRQLNEQQFMTSMACLIEVTSESYCSARDSMVLYNEGLKDLMVRQKTPTMNILDQMTHSQNNITPAITEKKSEDPLVGYYILTQHVPNITQWLQKIQIGVDPKLPTDAMFKNNILKEVTQFYQTVNDILGVYEKEKNTIRAQNSITAQRNMVVSMLEKISESIVSSRRGFDSNDSVNFFLTQQQKVFIPFLLIGRSKDQIPERVIPKNASTMPIDGLEYIKMKYNDEVEFPEFRDPVALADVVGRNVKLLIENANDSVIQYHNSWFITDEQALVMESVNNITYSVRDSFIAIDNYLKKFIKKSELILQENHKKNKFALDQKKNISLLLPVAENTRFRIKKILLAYDQAAILASDMIKKSPLDPGSIQDQIEYHKNVAEKYSQLIRTVYDEFNILLAKSGFLYNRLVQFVYQDYIMTITQGIEFTPNLEQEIFYATGRIAFDRLLQLHSNNPASVKQDLNMALSINKNNILALESLLADYYLKGIEKYKTVAWQPSALEHKKTKAGKWFESTHLGSAIKEKKLVQLTTQLSDTEFGSFNEMYKQFCIQSLAFNDYRPFLKICEGVTLNSPFAAESKNLMSQTKLNIPPSYLSVDYKSILASHAEDTRKNHSARICAFRDFNRRNLVFYLTLGQQRQ